MERGKLSEQVTSLNEMVQQLQVPPNKHEPKGSRRWRKEMREEMEKEKKKAYDEGHAQGYAKAEEDVVD